MDPSISSPRFVRVALAVRSALPEGAGLPEVEWQRRQRLMTSVLWLVAPLLLAYSLLRHYPLGHALLHALPLVAFGLMGHWSRLSRRPRTVATSLGLLTASALAVHSADGVTEAHFAFFVLIVAMTLYEDWVPFLLAVAFVLLHHGLLGTLDPSAVYSGAGQAGSPWKWAAIHGLFVAAAGAAGVTSWKFNERLRAEREEMVARLEVLARVDDLTGLSNRRGWQEQFTKEIKRAARNGQPLTIALVDLDGFKQVNDSRGHQAGDRVLRSVAAALEGSVRGSDYVARLGGDEFGVLLPDCEGGCAEQVVDRMRTSLPNGQLCSVGVVTWNGEESTRTVLSRADRSLYVAKAAGGGQAIMAGRQDPAVA